MEKKITDLMAGNSVLNQTLKDTNQKKSDSLVEKDKELLELKTQYKN
jgi:hypothetical protein